MPITDVRDAMLMVLPDHVWHYQAPADAGDKYIVWSEDSQGPAVHTDNRMTDQAIQGTVDLFTKQEYDPIAAKIQKALSLRGIPYYLRSIQHEEESGKIHFQWVWEVSD